MAAQKRWRSKRGPLPLRYVFLITLVLFTFSTAASLWIINKNVKPTLIGYAHAETKKLLLWSLIKQLTKRSPV
ncbi:hypothetical protein [Bacillus sp. PK3_68]|uniref:hypothetical protein n=1 Tax=Bacillus sp. PK3_68 TaxID=2027408 RepID=UPI002684E1B7